jgi:hypothetical protein
VRFGPAPLLVDKQLTWPFLNKSGQPIKSCPDEPSLDLLVGCFLCVQKLPSSAQATDLAPSRISRDEYKQMYEAESSKVLKLEPMAQQGVLLEERLKRVDTTFTGEEGTSTVRACETVEG